MRHVIESVRLQQQVVMRKLQDEQQRLEEELDYAALHELTGITPSTDIITEQGIPEEALQLSCPDEYLKVSVLGEFLLLDNKYNAQLEFLNVKYQHVKV